MTAAPIQVGDRVRVLTGRLPCSEFRPFQSCEGVVRGIRRDSRYPINVQLYVVHKVAAYMVEEVEPVTQGGQ